MAYRYNYASLLERIIAHYEEVAESNGQEGDIESYESQMESASKLKAGLNKFKEDYKLNRYDDEWTFLTPVFEILMMEYECDLAELKRWILPSYIRALQEQKEQLELELNDLERVNKALENLVTSEL